MTSNSMSSDVDTIAADAGKLERPLSMSGVTAIAPAVVKVVNTPPDDPNPFEGMTTGEVLKLPLHDDSRSTNGRCS